MWRWQFFSFLVYTIICEGKCEKYKKGNAGIVFLICALFVVIIAMGVFMLLDKTGSANSGGENEVNNGENTNTNSYANFLANAKKQGKRIPLQHIQVIWLKPI